MPVATYADPNYFLDFVRGEPRSIEIRLKAGTTPPYEEMATDGWIVQAKLKWTNPDTEVVLEDASALSINTTGVISGQIQPDVFTDMPEGTKAELIVKAYASETAEPITSIHPIRLWVA